MIKIKDIYIAHEKGLELVAPIAKEAIEDTPERPATEKSPLSPMKVRTGTSAGRHNKP